MVHVDVSQVVLHTSYQLNSSHSQLIGDDILRFFVRWNEVLPSIPLILTDITMAELRLKNMDCYLAR